MVPQSITPDGYWPLRTRPVAVRSSKVSVRVDMLEAVGAAVAVGVIVSNLYAVQPLLTAIGATMHIPGGAIGLIAMLPLLGYTCGQFLIVPLTDLYENRRLIVRLLMGSAVAAADSVLHPFLTAQPKQAPQERKTGG